MEFFMPAERPDGVDAVFPAMDPQGKLRWYKMDEKLYDDIASMYTPYTMHWLAEAVLATPARWFKMGTTGLRPTFAWLRNPQRDLQTFYFQTQSDGNALTLAKEWMVMLYRIAVDQGRKSVKGVVPTDLDKILNEANKLEVAYEDLNIRYGKAMRELDKPRNRDNQKLKDEVESIKVEGQAALLKFSEVNDKIEAAREKGQIAELELFKRLGGPVMQPMGLDMDLTRRTVRSIFRGTNGNTKSLKGVATSVWDLLAEGFEGYREFLQVPESATRVTELKMVAEKIGWDGTRPITLDESVQMLIALKRVSVDFSAVGSVGKILNRFIPFFNPQLQGLRQFARTMRTDKARFIRRGIPVFAFTMALWWRYKDEEWYKNIPWWERYTFWNVDTGKGVIRIPKAFEYGNFFAVMPEAIFDSAYNEDPEAFKAAFGHIFSPLGGGTTFPDIFGQPMLRVPFEQFAKEGGEVIFTGRPIVPAYQVNLAPGDQIGPYTSWLAKKIAEIYEIPASAALSVMGDERTFEEHSAPAAFLDFPRSPRRIDHAIRGFFGGLGPDLLHTMEGLVGEGMIDRISKVASGERGMEDIPFFGGQFRPGATEGYTNRATQELWRIRQYANDDYARMRADGQIESEDTRVWRGLVNDATSAISLVAYLERHSGSEAIRKKLQAYEMDIARDVLKYQDANTDSIRKKLSARIDEITAKIKRENVVLMAKAPKRAYQVSQKQIVAANRRYFSTGRPVFQGEGGEAPTAQEIADRRMLAARDYLFTIRQFKVASKDRARLAQAIRLKHGWKR
jgi:hypothetical protein